MKRKQILSVGSFVLFVIAYTLWSNGKIDPNKTRINDEVYLMKENETYSIFCNQKKTAISRRSNQSLIASKVDSVIISYKYGTLFHGLNDMNNEFEWFYIDVSPVKNIYKGYKDVQVATSSTMGESYLDSIMTSQETWEKYN